MKWEEQEEGNKIDLISPNPNKLSLSKKDSSSTSHANNNQKRCCNCKQSRCVKLYCECFANGVYCNSTCNCIDCWNNANNEEQRKSAIQSTLEKNPNAFQPKISTPNFIETKKAELNPNLFRHNKGCSCKKSGCMKKYCECFQAGIPCTELCKCADCHNTKQYYEKLKNNKNNMMSESIKQEDLGDSNALFFNFLLVCSDEDLLTKFVSDAKKPGQTRKEVNIQQQEVEGLYAKLMRMADMPPKEYFHIKENNQHLEEYFEHVRKKVKKENGNTVHAVLKNEFDSRLLKVETEQKSESHSQLKEQKAESTMEPENDLLACNDEDANELSNGFHQLEAVNEALTGTSHNRSTNGKYVGMSFKFGKDDDTGESIQEAHDNSKINMDSSSKLSLFKLKKNKILKDFISELRKFSGLNE